MKSRARKLLAAFAALTLLSTINYQLSTCFAQGTAFTYQGQLQNNGVLANGTFNLKFTLFDTNVTGTAVAGPVTNSDVAVSNGLFTVTIDFGGAVWSGATNWLQIGVETNGGSAFTALSPRQQVTPTPYAITAENLDGTVSSSGLSGTYGSMVTLNNPANEFTGFFTGNGAALTNVSAATLGGLAAGNFWQVGGNTGVPTGSNFIGNTDDQFLDLHANGVRAMRLRVLSDGLGLYTNAPNVIGGSAVNLTAANVVGATIAGGGGNFTNGFSFINEVTADFGTIGGGIANTAGRNATVSGGYGNNAGGIGSFIGGGGYDGNIFPGNSVQDNAATIGGGLANYIPSGGAYSTIGGGYHNTGSNGFVFVGGGFQNTAGGLLATVAGGANNTASWGYATVGGGLDNAASGTSSGYSTIGGGASNSASGDFGFIGGGTLNLLVANYSTIAGGYGNVASFPYAVVGGGYENVAEGSYATAAGGQRNTAEGTGATIGGGSFNIADAAYATVGGGYSNTASGVGSFIGGGGYNDDDNIGNLAAGTASVVGGGELNAIYSAGLYGTIAGGHENYINSDRGFIGGGEDNQMNGSGSVIGGGESNGTGSGSDNATVGGGYNNEANGTYSTIPGGQNNYADGKGSFAAGSYAGADFAGSFIWSDNTGTLTSDTAANQFVARASGGFFFYTGTGSAGAKLPAGATSWTAICDRNAKKNFQSVDTVAVLNKLAAVPIEQWNYKWEANTDTPNIGPMAQDFKAAFYPGRDDKGISTLEFDGVELAAIQGLNEKVEGRSQKAEAGLQKAENQIEELKAENAELKARLERLERDFKSEIRSSKSE